MGRMYSVLFGRTWKPVFLSTQGLPARFQARVAALRLAATSLARRGLWPQTQRLEESEESPKTGKPVRGRALACLSASSVGVLSHGIVRCPPVDSRAEQVRGSAPRGAIVTYPRTQASVFLVTVLERPKNRSPRFRTSRTRVVSTAAQISSSWQACLELGSMRSFHASLCAKLRDSLFSLFPGLTRCGKSANLQLCVPPRIPAPWHPLLQLKCGNGEEREGGSGIITAVPKPRSPCPAHRAAMRWRFMRISKPLSVRYPAC